MKRLTAMVLALCVFFSVQTVFVSAESAPEKTEKTKTRTVEEILDDYHQKSLGVQFNAEKNDGASTRSAASGKTLEQETVEELNAAGYEAYNVTSDNYESLEKTLKTDFGSMGLDPNGSYIITISGDEENAPNNSNSRGRPFIEQVGGTGDGTGGSSVVMHTYNGKTYTMRYITVTAAENNKLYQRTEVDVSGNYDADDLLDDLRIPMQILAYIPFFEVVSVLYTLLTELPTVETGLEALEYEGRTNWTITYLQICDVPTNTWKYAGSTEYVTMTYTLSHSYYDPTTNSGQNNTISNDYAKIYSKNYYETALMKDQAVYAYLNNTQWCDSIDSVEYMFNDEVVITHNRQS